ncbi:SWITCH1 [Euphorbia peplus]|nr:SWITCH1 [Euphorbia peplus]
MSELLLLDHAPIDDPADHIYVGSFYEIDHSKLPQKSPHQLNSIRLVMVSEKTRTRVSLRYATIYSLNSYFSLTNFSTKTLPQLDEKFTVSPEIAAEALYRRVSHEEITLKMKSWCFWAVDPIPAPRVSMSLPSISRSRSCFVSRKKGCLSGIQSTGMVKWGQRRQVRYLASHKGKSVTKEEIKEDDEEESEEEEDNEEEEKEEISDLENEKKRKRKQLMRSCKFLQNNNKKISPKPEIKNQIVVYSPKNNKKKVFKNTINRWSSQRYQLAEENMLKIMKDQGAVFGSPILRPELRAQARKLIGDTGLLDHLLKHMAGKVAPGGELRFRRRHNAEGAMEYWLENANLFDIRREAGIQDPYWTPPPGWHPGDNPTQDPICAMEFKILKEEVSNLKKNYEMLLSKKNEEQPATAATLLNEMYIDLMSKKVEIEEQMIKLSHYLSWMEEENEKIKTQQEGSNRSTESSDVTFIALPETASTATELKEKALERVAKIERLRSGFSICKPQATFLLPNGSCFSPQAAVHFEGLFTVPTPPSISSTPPRLLPSPTSPLKPLALTRPISSSLCCHSNSSKSCIINLNEVPPSNQNDYGSQCHGENSSIPVTYQRRNHNTIFGTEMKEMNQ